MQEKKNFIVEPKYIFFAVLFIALLWFFQDNALLVVIGSAIVWYIFENFQQKQHDDEKVERP